MGISRDTFIFDIGTSSTRIAKAGCGILMREPTVAAIGINGDNRVLAAGKKAVLLYNKFPNGIVLKSPFKAGRLMDGALLTSLLKKLFESNNERFKRGASRQAIVTLRYGVDSICKKQILDAVRFSISGSAKTVSSTLCIAHGTDVYERSFIGGTALMDIGVKRTTAAILCFGRICTQAEIAYGAGDINAFVSRNENTLNVRESLKQALKPVINMMEDLFIGTMPELVGDIISNGIFIAGGGAKIPFISESLSDIIGVDALCDEAAGDAVILGALKLNSKKLYNENIENRSVSI